MKRFIKYIKENQFNIDIKQIWKPKECKIPVYICIVKKFIDNNNYYLLCPLITEINYAQTGDIVYIKDNIKIVFKSDLEFTLLEKSIIDYFDFYTILPNDIFEYFLKERDSDPVFIDIKSDNILKSKLIDDMIILYIQEWQKDTTKEIYKDE